MAPCRFRRRDKRGSCHRTVRLEKMLPRNSNPPSGWKDHSQPRRNARCSLAPPLLMPLPLLLLLVHFSLPIFCPSHWPPPAHAAASGLPGSSSSSSCKGGLKCENGGVCQRKPDGTDVCRCPPPASALEPSFFVGARCHIPAVMCADTDTFYCAFGSTCVEEVQGEKYSCEGCNSAVSGLHCDAEGMRCGGPKGLMCFNGGTCSISGTMCICPVQWSGNENCTAPTPGYGQEGDTWQDEEQTWYVPLLGALGALIMLTILGALIYFCYPKQATTTLARNKDSDETLGLQDHAAIDSANDESDGDLELSEVRNSQRPQSHEEELS